GFPLGLVPTVTKGIVSAENRSIPVGNGDTSQRLRGLIQTDAAINPGNSGGPLVDSLGQVVGINTAAAKASTAQNIGFSIAIDEALPIVREILTEPPARQAWLGISTVSVGSNVDDAQLGLAAGTRGALVTGVFPSSPASSAGLKPGELIVAIGGTTVRSTQDLASALARYSPGQSTDVIVVTGAGRRTVRVLLAQRPPA
ncbi:MAG: S1C family serine protease, partial [Actinomycetota bacterium]